MSRMSKLSIVALAAVAVCSFSSGAAAERVPQAEVADRRTGPTGRALTDCGPGQYSAECNCCVYEPACFGGYHRALRVDGGRNLHDEQVQQQQCSCPSFSIGAPDAWPGCYTCPEGKVMMVHPEKNNWKWCDVPVAVHSNKQHHGGHKGGQHKGGDHKHNGGGRWHGQKPGQPQQPVATIAVGEYNPSAPAPASDYQSPVKPPAVDDGSSYDQSARSDSGDQQPDYTPPAADAAPTAADGQQ